jgi:hypothetical protein
MNEQIDQTPKGLMIQRPMPEPEVWRRLDDGTIEQLCGDGTWYAMELETLLNTLMYNQPLTRWILTPGCLVKAESRERNYQSKRAICTLVFRVESYEVES